ncbi:MAG: hypothetical protein K2O42_07185, partial [Oscillospiraceae bacterium]|nr:hypothetical protein [Oscillospiraceae bacterium]
MSWQDSAHPQWIFTLQRFFRQFQIFGAVFPE